MRLKIISDGRSHGTKVVNAETGEAIELVQSITWKCDINNEPTATIVVILPELDATVDLSECNDIDMAEMAQRVADEIKRQQR